MNIEVCNQALLLLNNVQHDFGKHVITTKKKKIILLQLIYIFL